MGRNRLSNVFVAHPVPNLASGFPLSIPEHHLLSFIKVAHVETGTSSQQIRGKSRELPFANRGQQRV
jgi:hypothetical protein